MKKTVKTYKVQDKIPGGWRKKTLQLVNIVVENVCHATVEKEGQTARKDLFYMNPDA